MASASKPSKADAVTYTFEPIGFIESPYKEKFGTPRQPGLVAESRGAVVLREDLNPDAFDGLADFSHAWVIFVFHENQSVREGRKTVKTKVHPPRLEGKAVGVFATRSPHRPNPLGLSLVKIEKIEGRRLSIQGLDLIDGTPVLDVKPYLPTVEALPDAVEGWSGPLASKTVKVEWSERALGDLQTLFRSLTSDPSSISTHASGSVEEVRIAIEKILELDPRPVSYRGTTENPDPYTSRYGFRYRDWNVVFQMLTPADPSTELIKRARIETIEAWSQN